MGRKQQVAVMKTFQQKTSNNKFLPGRRKTALPLGTDRKMPNYREGVGFLCKKSGTLLRVSECDHYQRENACWRGSAKVRLRERNKTGCRVPSQTQRIQESLK